LILGLSAQQSSPKEEDESHPDSPSPEETVKKDVKDTTFSSLSETIDVVASDRTVLDPTLYGEQKDDRQ